MRGLVVVTVLLAGCVGPGPSDAGLDASDAPLADGGTDAPRRDAPSNGDLTEDFCAPFAEAACDAAIDCGCGVVLPGGMLDRDACVARGIASCETTWRRLVETGGTFDRVRARACLETVRVGTPTCALPSLETMYAVCSPFIVDAAELGEPCTSYYCARGAGFCMGGTCVLRTGPHTPCSDAYSCSSGLSCEAGTCTARGGAGAACDRDLDCVAPLRCVSGAVCGELVPLGAACTETVDCAIGLVCASGVCAAGPSSCADGEACGNGASCAEALACVPRFGAAEPCGTHRDCAPELYCDRALCAPRPAEGEACGRGEACAAGLGCDPLDTTCRALPAEGRPCAFDETGDVCASGLACADGTCRALPSEGAPCAGTRCAAGLGCDVSAAGAICVVPRGEGEPCGSDGACEDALHCGPAGTCEPDLPAGAPCTANECAGVCTPTPGGAYACRDAPTLGEPCGTATECPSTTTCGIAANTCLPSICAVM